MSTDCGWKGKCRYGSFRLRMNVWVCRQNFEIPWEDAPYLSASAVVIHYEEALYQVYAPFTFYIYVGLHSIVILKVLLPFENIQRWVSRPHQIVLCKSICGGITATIYIRLAGLWITRWLQIRFDCDSTARRLFDVVHHDRTPNCVRALLRSGLNK